MNKYFLLTLLALALVAVALPVYGLREPQRMEDAQADLRAAFVSDAAVMYVENCAVCHGAAGEGIGPNPVLDNPGLRAADYDLLFKTIARGRYDTAMAAWHADEGGIYNDYQIDELVALIRYVDWRLVGDLSAQRGLIPPTLPVPEVSDELLAQVAALGPEAERWAAGMQTFAENCTICHGISGEGSDLGVALNTAELRAKDADTLARTIREGVPGTMMASWSKVLDDDAIADVVAFLRHWDAVEAAGLHFTAPAPLEIDLNNPQEILALGQRIFDATCSACHGENGSGGSGPVLNSQQILTRNTDEQLRTAIVSGGRRPNSTMPAFGDRMTSVEIDAVVDYLRSWEPTAPQVANPRGSDQGGGPPWQRATPDPNNPIDPGRGGGPPAGRGPNRTTESTPQAGQAPAAAQGPVLSFKGEVVTVQDNLLTFRTDDGAVREAMLGPPWFWSENGISLEPGNVIELEGFESTDHMELNWLRNVTTGQLKLLRTAEGAPVWTQ
jgi:mono/diheme cytochrome c family protein